jgi:hypothetical protein
MQTQSAERWRCHANHDDGEGNEVINWVDAGELLDTVVTAPRIAAYGDRLGGVGFRSTDPLRGGEQRPTDQGGEGGP